MSQPIESTSDLVATVLDAFKALLSGKVLDDESKAFLKNTMIVQAIMHTTGADEPKAFEIGFRINSHHKDEPNSEAKSAAFRVKSEVAEFLRDGIENLQVADLNTRGTNIVFSTAVPTARDFLKETANAQLEAAKLAGASQSAT